MSPTNIPILTLSIAATAAITEFRAIGYDGGVAAAGAAMFGLAQTDAAIGEQVATDVLGTSIGTAGAVVAFGDELQVGTDGKLIPLAAGTKVGRALSGGGDGNRIEVLLIPA